MAWLTEDWACMECVSLEVLITFMGDTVKFGADDVLAAACMGIDTICLTPVWGFVCSILIVCPSPLFNFSRS